MTTHETALRFLELFCAGDLLGLESLLAEDLMFQGPLFRGSSRQEYLQALRSSPPLKTPYSITSVSDDSDGSVTIEWEYLKETQPLRISQQFTVRRERITRITLAFLPEQSGKHQ